MIMWDSSGAEGLKYVQTDNGCLFNRSIPFTHALYHA